MPEFPFAIFSAQGIEHRPLDTIWAPGARRAFWVDITHWERDRATVAGHALVAAVA